MAHTLSQLAALAVAPVLAPSLAQAQDHLFRTWFEAPDTVLAGETFQVWMWATFETNGEAATNGWFNGAHGSIEVSGDLHVFSHISPVLDGLPLRFSIGEVDGAWLRDFAIAQNAYLPGADLDPRNPIPVLMFEVTTAVHGSAVLMLDLRAPSDSDRPLLTWRDESSSAWISTQSADVGLVASTLTINVIPGPGSIATLSTGYTLYWCRRRTRGNPCRCRCR